MRWGSKLVSGRAEAETSSLTGKTSLRAAACCLLIGQSSAGKTLFALRFISYLGGRDQVRAERIRVSIPETGKELELIDSSGLSGAIHPDAEARAAAARTLRALIETDICLHVADAAAIGCGAPVSAVDRELTAYARRHLTGRYALLAGKIDHPLGRAGMFKLQRELGPEKVIPVSALTGTGFREVLAFLASRLTRGDNLT